MYDSISQVKEIDCLSFLESDEKLRATIRNWFDTQTSILYSKGSLYKIIHFSSKLFNLNLKLVYVI